MKIAIASGKGGAGKTSLATNLSALMAEQVDVTLVDMDVEEPDTSIFFQFTPSSEEIREKKIPVWNPEKCISCGKCQQQCNFNAIIKIIDEIIVFPELCHSCHACAMLCPESALAMEGKRIGITGKTEIDKLTLIENRLDVGEEQAVPLIAQSLEDLDKEYSPDQIIIMDAPPGTSCPLIEVALAADLVILVAEPTPFGLNDLKLAAETMKLLQREFVVVINRFGIGDDEIFNYCREEEIPIVAKIPDSRKAAELYAIGKLFYKEIPEIRKEIEKVSEFIISRNKACML